MRSLSSAHHDAGGEREAEQAPQRREPDQAGAGRAGKADMRERVAGEGLPAHHQEIADDARHHRHDAGGGEGIVHEFILEHVSLFIPSAPSASGRELECAGWLALGRPGMTRQ